MLRQVIEMFDMLDKADASGGEVKAFLEAKGANNVVVEKFTGDKGSTDFIRIRLVGLNGKTVGGDSPTLGIAGRLGGLGARPELTGFVSDGDGALVALAVASKLVDMQNNGDTLKGDIIVTTHICPDAPTKEHYPVPFMGSPVDIETTNKIEVSDDMDAILSVDTTKGNKIINHKGFGISNTVKEGYILRVSDQLCDIMMRTTGHMPFVFPLSQQDITPYGNGLYHINSILQPTVATTAPVVGVALTTAVPVAGCATGATHIFDIECAARFCIEVAKDFGEKKCEFYDVKEFDLIQKLYGDMTRFQTKGN